MPIRFVDRRANLGRIVTVADGVAGALQGTHTQPAGRIGILAPQLGTLGSNIVGTFTQSAVRNGQIIASLGGAAAAMQGTFVGAGIFQPWSGILDSQRADDWKNSGVNGGIPNRTTIAQTLNAGATLAQINTAIANAPANSVVVLGPGTFTIAGPQIGRSNVTLRGSGAHLTTLKITSGSSFLGLNAAIACGSQFMDMAGTIDHSVAWSAGFAKGTTVITLANVTGLTVGQVLILNQLNDTSVPANDIVTGSSLPFSYDGGGGGGAPGSREQTETHRVVAINGTNVTIDPPLIMPNWTSAKTPRAWWNNTATVSGVGIEDMTIDMQTASVDRGICFLGMRDSWVRGVKSRFAPRNHVWCYQSANCEFKDMYIHEGQSHAQQSYGIETGDSTRCRTWNCISSKVTSAWMVSGASTGCVRAYCYSINDPFAGDWMQGAEYFHCTGSGYVLDEGNITPGYILDQVHGPSSHCTLYRSCIEGFETGKAQQTTPFHDYANSRFQNALGNVLGRQGYHTIYESNPNNNQNYNAAVYTLGWGDNGDHGGGSMPADDMTVVTTLVRWGNCDPTNNWTPRFNASEVPSGIAKYANAVPASQTLPPSMFLAAKPDFWPAALPWPCIGPDVTGGDIANKGGRAYSNPAKRFYDSATKDANGEITSFNPALYYQ